MAARPICIAVKADGNNCTRQAVVGQQRCTTHLNTINANGPNTNAVKELGYKHKQILRNLTAEWAVRIDAEVDDVRKRALIEDFDHVYDIQKIQQRHEKGLLVRAQQEEIRRTGIDPDREANRRRILEQHARNERFREQVDAARERLLARAEAQQVNAVVNRAINVQQHVGELQQFANDNQNIHTVRAVNMTKDMVALILTIPVPEDHKWNQTECSKTPGDIIMTCRLSPKAAWQMTSKYCQAEAIYDICQGVYGKVLDGVWQYIVTSPDKADLTRVLKQEMEDNIGMCAQGNLSRLCNILAGYMEGIGSQESVADILGRLMPKLMDIDALSERLTEALRILKENNVPLSQWKSWVDPLTYDQDAEMTVAFIRNADDNVIGFMAVEV